MFSYAWKVTGSVMEEDKYKETLCIVRKDGISLTGGELRDYKLYAPDDMIYRALVTDFQISGKKNYSSDEKANVTL